MRDDEMQIGEVLIRYASGIDQRDWPLFRTCWTHDVVVDYDTLGCFSGVDAITDVMTTAHQNMGPTYHRLSNFVIDVEGDGASVRSYVHAVLMVAPGDSANWVEAIGSYDDVFVRTAEGWRISRRTSRVARMLTAGDLATALSSGSAADRR
jgi:3-phenylpropionate/cinnamic acid dioxygenase small subunit